MRPPLPKRALRSIEEHSLIDEAATLLVGVSGGPDSVCLLHVLLQMKDRLASSSMWRISITCCGERNQMPMLSMFPNWPGISALRRL